MLKTALGLVLIVLAVALLVWWWRPTTGPRQVVVPTLSAEAEAGKVAFDRNCAACHGLDAAGSEKGPPLVERTYHPGHHSDAAFELAVKRGVRAHHWLLGDMPPQPRVSRDEVARITRYVRELQKANGIF